MLLVIRFAYRRRKAEPWIETGDGMEIYTGLDIVRSRAEDRQSEIGHEKGNGLNSDSDTCWPEGDANLSSFSEVRRGVCLYLLP